MIIGGDKMDKIKSQTLFNLWEQMKGKIQNKGDNPKEALIDFLNNCASESKQIIKELGE